MKLKSLALAAALVASSASSFAAGGSLGLISDNASFSSTVAAGAFADVWTFDTSVVDANASITNIRTKKFSNYITSFEAWLDGKGWIFSNHIRIGTGGNNELTNLDD